VPSISFDAQSAAALEGGIYASKEEGPYAGHQIQTKTQECYEEEKGCQKEEEVTNEFSPRAKTLRAGA